MSRIRMNTLLVIGGSGFFGKSILDAYRRGLLSPWGIKKIIVMARNARQVLECYPELTHPLQFSSLAKDTAQSELELELLDADITSCDTFPKADYVIHAAASTDARKYLENSHIEKLNIQRGTINFCKLAKICLKESKILYVSSGAVYGQQQNITHDLNENSTLMSIEDLAPNKQDYAAAKRDSEMIMQDFASAGCRVAIARCFAFIGPYLPRDQHFAIGNFISNGLLGKSIVVKADKLVYRSYLFADDLVMQLMTILSKASISCPIYNCGSENPYEIREVGKLVASYFNVDINEIHPDDYQDKHADYYIPNVQKISEIIGNNFTTLEDAIELTVRSIKKNGK